MDTLIIVTNSQNKASRYALDRGIINYKWVDTQRWNNFVERRDWFEDSSYPMYVIIPETIGAWDIAKILIEEEHYDLFKWLQLCEQTTGIKYDFYYLQQYFNQVCTISLLGDSLFYETRDGCWKLVPSVLEPLFFLEENRWILKSVEE